MQKFVLFYIIALIYSDMVACYVFGYLPLWSSIPELQSDDLKLSSDQSDYWRLSPVSNDIAIKHGWQNSMILKATSQGQGKLAASLTYFSALNEKKEVMTWS